MSFMKSLLGGGSDSPDDYAEAEFEGREQTEQTAEHLIQTVSVEGTKDILTVKDHLHEGNIVFMEIPSTSKISAEHILDDVKQTVDQIGGDMAARTEEEVIVAPAGFFIARKRQ